jgi:hypothetical protein
LVYLQLSWLDSATLVVSGLWKGMGVREFGLHIQPVASQKHTIRVEVVSVTALLTHFGVLLGDSICSTSIAHTQPA